MVVEPGRAGQRLRRSARPNRASAAIVARTAPPRFHTGARGWIRVRLPGISASPRVLRPLSTALSGRPRTSSKPSKGNAVGPRVVRPARPRRTPRRLGRHVSAAEPRRPALKSSGGTRAGGEEGRARLPAEVGEPPQRRRPVRSARRTSLGEGHNQAARRSALSLLPMPDLPQRPRPAPRFG